MKDELVSDERVTGHFYVPMSRVDPELGAIIEATGNQAEVGIPLYGRKGAAMEGAAACPECSERQLLYDASWAFVLCHYCGHRP